MQTTAEWVRTNRTGSQTDRFARTYRFGRRWRRHYFAARYVRRRLHEVATALRIEREGQRVLDVGFGSGHLLASFPKSCRLEGAEVSRSAVEGARGDPRFAEYRAAAFHRVREGELRDLPAGPFDWIVSSHALEHVPDDRAMLAAWFERLRPGGWLALFVPIEAPDHNPDHRHSYSLETIAGRVAAAGFELHFLEGGLHAQGHFWKLLTIPGRRRWPVLGPLVEVFRVLTLSLVPYRVHRWLDRQLPRLGVGPCQA